MPPSRNDDAAEERDQGGERRPERAEPRAAPTPAPGSDGTHDAHSRAPSVIGRPLHAREANAAPKTPSDAPAAAPSSDAARCIVAQRYEAELDERRRTRGHSHPSVAETLNALGLVHQHMRTDPESALRCHGEALRILRRASAACSAQPAGAANGGPSGSRSRSTGGEPSSAAAEPADAIDDAIDSGSDLRFDVAVTLSDVGDAHWKMGSYDAAHAAYGSALEEFATAGKGNDHPRVVSTARRLARLGRGWPA